MTSSGRTGRRTDEPPHVPVGRVRRVVCPRRRQRARRVELALRGPRLRRRHAAPVMAMAVELDYAAACADEYGRRLESDALRAFAPYPKQAEFFSDDDTREVHMLGANRSGKTIALCARAARLVRDGLARKLWIVSKTNAATRQNILPYLYEWEGSAGPEAFIPKTEIARIRTVPDHEIVGKDGWSIVLKSCQQGADTMAGAAVDEILFDEPPDWPVYRECSIRFAAGKAFRLRIAATLLPAPGEAGGICKWLWAEKIEPWLRKAAPDDFKIINVAMRDNPHITP